MTNTTIDLEHASHLYIGGSWAGARSGRTASLVSPHTEEAIAEFALGGAGDIDAAVAAARRSFDAGVWRDLPIEERLAPLRRLSELYVGRMGELADLITHETGCPTSFSQLAQGTAPLMILNRFLEVAADYPWEESRVGSFSEYLVRREAIGVVGIITPWNIPQAAIVSKLVPALIAGCSAVVKPSDQSPLDAIVLAELLDECGLPEGVVSIINGDVEAGTRLVEHPEVDKIAFTGSTQVGRSIAAACGTAMRRCTLELGGKSAAIVLDDAELDPTIDGLRTAALLNSGQACVAQTRLLVSRRRHDEVVDALCARISAMQVGDPWDPATEIGPMATKAQRDRVERCVAQGVAEGAAVALGGDAPLSTGWYVAPTVLVDVANDNSAAREEIFGPVVCVIPYDDEAQAVSIANDSPYGLSGTVWTEDHDHGLGIARQVRVGAFGINGLMMDVDAPFGGFKQSGVGRELGVEGLNAYTEVKSIVTGF